MWPVLSFCAHFNIYFRLQVLFFNAILLLENMFLGTQWFDAIIIDVVLQTVTFFSKGENHLACELLCIHPLSITTNPFEESCGAEADPSSH